METEISKDPIFASECGEHIINLNWLSHEKPLTCDRYQEVIEILSERMIKDTNHEKDLLFLPFLDLIEKYLDSISNIEFPAEIQEHVDRMKQVITYTREKHKAKERINVDFKLFHELLKTIFDEVEGIQTTMEDIPVENVNFQ